MSERDEAFLGFLKEEEKESDFQEIERMEPIINLEKSTDDLTSIMRSMIKKTPSEYLKENYQEMKMIVKDFGVKGVVEEIKKRIKKD